MCKLFKTSSTKEEEERLFDDPEKEKQFDKLIEEGCRLLIEEEWEKEKNKVYPKYEFSERHKKQMEKLFKKVARREKTRYFFRVNKNKKK